MFINHAMQSAGGYLVIRVEGRFLERFLNVCSRRDIYLWDIKRLSPTTLSCKISVKGFRCLPEVARKTHCRARIVDKRGLPIVLHRYRRRRWFAVGIAVFLLALLSLNLYVWKIEVRGNERVPTDIILQELDSFGVRVGQFRFRLDEKTLQNQMVAKIPQLAWLWVNKQGSKLVVEVKERDMAPAVVDKTQICDLVATRDGVIKTMNVREGKNLVAVGDTVLEGQTLVTGTIDIENVGVRTVHADGEVLARTWYEKTQAFSLTKREQVPTGNTKNRWSISLFSHTLPLGREPSYADCQHSRKDYDLALGNLYFGISLHKDTYTELSTQETPLTPEEVIASGAEQVKRAIRQSAGLDAEVVREDVTSNIIDEDTVEVTVIAEYIENIARQVPTAGIPEGTQAEEGEALE